MTTCAEFDAATAVAEECGGAAFIKVVTDAEAAPLLPHRLHESIKTLYQLA